MEKLEKILNILENNAPSESERTFLQESLSDTEVKKFVETYKVLKKAVSGSDHIDSGILGEYILYKRGDDPSFEYISLVADKISSHLKSCDRCSKEYQLLSEEYNSINEFLDKHIAEPKADTSTVFLFRASQRFKVAVTAAMVILVSYFGMRVVSDLSTPAYKQMIVSSQDDTSLLTRGRTSVLFQKSINALEKEDYDKAIEFLKEDIEQNNSDNSIFYSHYVLGLTYLKASESDFLGAFRSYDHKKVAEGIKHLKLSIEKNNSGYYKNLKLDAHFYIAKGYLMIDNTEAAKEHLQTVVAERGKYYKQAEELLNSLEEN